VSIPGGIPGDNRPRSGWRRALVYFGLAEDPDNPDSPDAARDAPAAIAGGRAAARPADESTLARLERKIDAQGAAIDALRAEVERLGRRER
jgi:hypothetical protein